MTEYQEAYATRKETALTAGEIFDEEERTFESIECSGFKTADEKYVVGIDTLG